MSSRIFFKNTVLATLFAVSAQTGCNAPVDPAHIDVKKVRLQIKENLMAAISAAESESAKASKNPMLKTFTPNNANGDPTGGEVTGGSSSEPIIAPLFAQLLDSAFGKDLFAEANIISSDETQVLYAMPSTLCPKLREAAGKEPKKEGDAPDELDATIAKCKTFLEQNNVQLHVKSRGVNDFELGLKFAIRDGKNADPELVSSLHSNTNLLEQTLDLQTLYRFVSALQSLNKDDEAASLPSFAKLAGTLSWTLRFKGQGNPSDCPDKADACLSLNVDKAIELEGKLGEDFMLKLAASPKERPTFYMSSDNEGAFNGQVNVSEITGKAKGERFLLAGASFDLSIPGLPSTEPVLQVKNIVAVNKTSWVDLMGKRVSWDFNKAQDGKLDSVRIWNKPSEVMLELSPLSLAFEITGGSDPDCAPKETLTFSTKPSGNTKLKWAKSMPEPSAPENNPVVLTSTRDAATKSECTTNELLLLLPLQLFKSSDQCASGALLSVDQGQAQLAYQYEIVDNRDKLTIELAEGQCLKPVPMGYIGRSLLPFKIQNRMKKTAMLYIEKSGIGAMFSWLKEKTNPSLKRK